MIQSPLEVYGISCNPTLIYGIGYKDIEYATDTSVELPQVNGKRKRKTTWRCPYYSKWVNMLQRSGYLRYKEKNLSYLEVTICDEWLIFSNFVRWVDNQPNSQWFSCELDKDFIKQDNKHYHPDLCCFIPKKLNLFCTNKKGQYLTGVYRKSNGRFQAKCRSIHTGLSESLGCFDTELEAHLAWKAKKHEYACELAELQDNIIVAEVLRSRFK